MHTNFARVISVTLFMGIAAFGCNTASAQGWFKKATGVKTPDPIRKIAPDGLSNRRGPESGSKLAVEPDVRTYNGNPGKGRNGSGTSGSSTVRTNENRRPPQSNRPVERQNSNGDILFDDRVQTKKMPNSRPSGSKPAVPQSGLTQQQQEQALIANSIGQLIQGISQAAEQNRQQQNSQSAPWGQQNNQEQQQWSNASPQQNQQSVRPRNQQRFGRP